MHVKVTQGVVSQICTFELFRLLIMKKNGPQSDFSPEFISLHFLSMGSLMGATGDSVDAIIRP